MIRTRTICPDEACLMAVSALDDMVTALVKANFLKVSPAFLDWVADEATPLVEQQIEDGFAHPVFAASLRQADHRVALTNWMRHWVCPAIVARFSELAPHLPAYTAMQALAPTMALQVPTGLPLATLPVPPASGPMRPRATGVLGMAVPA